MRKVFGYIFLIVFLVFALNLCYAAPKKSAKKPLKHKIEFTTRDKFILVGDLYMPANPTDKPLVICLHSYAMNAQAWSDLALNLRQKGYSVLAMDLRGHGRSVYNENLKLKSRFYYSRETWQKLPKDVIDSIKYVKANYPKINCDDVIIVGADFGAGVGANAAIAMRIAPKKLVLISPMLEFKGITMPIKSVKLYDTNIFIVLSKTDKHTFNIQTKTPATVKRYQNGGPGNQLLKANPDALNDVVNFIIN